MANIFLASDHHLSQKGIITFLREDGSPLRAFDSIEEHDEYIIHQHNKVVKPNDKVYFLGDVTFHRRNLVLLGRMNGSKVLIKGNHDVLDLKDYIPYFKDIRGCHILDKMLLTHIPTHPESLSRWIINIHGHLHANRVLTNSGEVDQRYHSVCMEHLESYTPISLEQLKAKIKHVSLPR
jgi:calcineurin-like phosphoesterase family protein